VDDLSSLLLAAIEETDRLAREADTNGHWLAHEHGYVAFYDSGPETFWNSVDRPERARHIAHHDPASVLRRCAGERQAIAMCNAAIKQYERGDGEGEHEKGVVAGAYLMASMVLTHIAEGYGITDHRESEGA
jgi:hypothetical protein